MVGIECEGFRLWLSSSPRSFICRYALCLTSIWWSRTSCSSSHSASYFADWGKNKIKATPAISSPLAPWQIGPLSNRGPIYQAEDGYWNCPTGHKSDRWMGLYLRQGRHHSAVAGRGRTSRLESILHLSWPLTSLWPGAAGPQPDLHHYPTQCRFDSLFLQSAADGRTLARLALSPPPQLLFLFSKPFLSLSTFILQPINANRDRP